MSLRVESTSYANNLYKCYEKIQEPGEIQNRFLAGLRTTVGIAAVYLDPTSALVSAGATIAKPEYARFCVQKSDDILTALWDGMTPNQRVVAFAVGVVVTYYSIPYLWFPAAICSAKIGAELALGNVNKERESAAMRKAKAEVQKF